MTFHREFQFRPLLFSAASLISLVSFTLAFAANPPAAPKPQEETKVVGHLELPGMHVQHIFMQQREDKNYLLLRRTDMNSFAIVDVTDPSKPVLIDRHALRERAGGHLEMPPPGSVLALAFAPEADSGSAGAAAKASSASLPTETVRLIDLSDPKHPKTVRAFKGVTSVATDDGRKLIFLVNNEGLWIVSHHRERPLPLCTSESALQFETECN